MKFTKYLLDNFIEIILGIINTIIIILLLTVFKMQKELIIACAFLNLLTHTLILIISYNRKKTFYKEIKNNVANLDKAYLVLETIKEPTFLEGKIIYDSLYEINKSYLENINYYNAQINDFKDYIELWIHEVKIPVSCLTLIAHNNIEKKRENIINQIKRIDDYLEQVIYYVRSENANKDYLIKKINLKKCINTVALKNKDYLLESKIDLIVENVSYEVYTDSKWLEFIINQIVNNSIKYRKDNCKSYIKIYTIEKPDTLTIVIEDNGIGIKESDIDRVFDKTFTGTNGRIKNSSTGMGLFIVKNLCTKLGHLIKIESSPNKYTKVFITISTNKYYEVAKK